MAVPQNDGAENGAGVIGPKVLPAGTVKAIGRQFPDLVTAILQSMYALYVLYINLICSMPNCAN